MELTTDRNEVVVKKVKLTIKNYKHPKHPNRIEFEIYINEDELDKMLEELKHPHFKHPHTQDIPTAATTTKIVIY